MAKEVNFSDRTAPRVDPHIWTERPSAIIYHTEDGRIVKVKDLTVNVCSRCQLALVILPDHVHDLPPCKNEAE